MNLLNDMEARFSCYALLIYFGTKLIFKGRQVAELESSFVLVNI